MKLSHFIETQQLSKELIFELFKKAEYFKQNIHKKHKKMEGKILATLFYEPSTRTRLSFESAMLRLGGDVLGTENAREFSSAIKGESLEDTIRVVGNYCDIIVLRHHEEGSSRRGAEISKVPLINAGDGKGQHPTQALLDIFTIRSEIGRANNLKVAIVGDLKYGRTARSLSYLLCKLECNEITYISPKNLGISKDIKDYLNKHSLKFREENELEKILPEIDVVYMTRIQRERMSEKEFEEAKGKYSINELNLDLINKNSRILHPLPHAEEINLSRDVEETDSRIAYFRQAENGLYVRMALLEHLIC